MSAFKTTDILNSIRRRTMLPDSDSTFSDNDLLEMVEDEMRYFAIPHLLSAKEDYLLTFEDIEIQATVKSYPIPYRAVGGVIRDIYRMKDGEQKGKLTRIDIDDLDEVHYNGMGYGNHGVFYLESNNIVFPGDVGSTYPNEFIRVYFYLEPNKLSLEKYTGVITGIDLNTGVITLNEFPNDFANLPKLDFIQLKTPNKIYDYDIAPTSANKNAKTVTFNVADIPPGIEVGDMLSPAGTTTVLQLPKEFQKVVCQRVAVQVLESLGDSQLKDSAEARLVKMEKAVINLVANRVNGAAQKILPKGTVVKRNQRYRDWI